MYRTSVLKVLNNIESQRGNKIVNVRVYNFLYVYSVYSTHIMLKTHRNARPRTT